GCTMSAPTVAGVSAHCCSSGQTRRNTPLCLPWAAWVSAIRRLAACIAACSAVLGWTSKSFADAGDPDLDNRRHRAFIITLMEKNRFIFGIADAVAWLGVAGAV